MRKLLAAIGAAVLVLVVLAGCGSSSSSSSSSASTSTPTSSGANASIAAQVPAAIKSKGTLNVATEAQYAPNEFIASDGKTVIGMDAELMEAIGGVLGLKVNLVNSDFETIIPGLAAGRYDLGASSFTDTKEREKTVDFVDYFEAGISFYAKSSANTGVETVEDLCGKTVAAEKGTVEQEEAEAQSKKCTKAGKKSVNTLSFPGQNAVNLAVSSGRAELGMADSPVADYQVKQSSGAFKLIGKEYEVAPYGIAIPKKSGMTQPVLAALKAVIADGTYSKILAKWGLQSGAIKEPKVNGATG
ncbi:MAG TPA: ABC transporter substrate-binding protein [Solirubrobacteraceae bacterium]|jgi:polar amino acid transport system substrate-binding protein|nr:ABC transporter substrate-binding protein [Solirubrobacteraceae bacterium]